MKIEVLKPATTDILILDSLGIKFLRTAIPDNYVVSALNTRENYPIVLRCSFFRDFILLAVRFRLRLYKSYIFALINQYRPKVIITFADTNPMPGEYAQFSRTTRVLSVQNANRNKRAVVENIRAAPVYIGFGNAMKELFNKLNVPFQRVVSAGSLPLGLYLAQRHKVEQSRELVFISSYRAEFEESDSTTPIVESMSKVHEIMVKNLFRYSKEHQTELTVIAKGKVANEGEHYIHEKTYFDRLAKNQAFCLSSTVKDTYKSYAIALSARVLVTVDSTLGYEALGVGKRVLFGWRLDSTLFDYGEHYIKYLPEELRLSENSYEHFEYKLNELIRLSDKRILDLCANARSEYMDQDLNHPPHEKIKKEIVSYLSENI